MKKPLFIAFVALCLVQLYFPSKMIWDKEAVLNTGKEFKFKTAPLDPNDPFRGKYINLRFEANEFEINHINDWDAGETAYVHISTDSSGFAQIERVTKSPPEGKLDFLKTSIRYVENFSPPKIIINYPFTRYYMEESKAKAAELAHRRSLTNAQKVTYALVNIKNGDAVLKDVMINGVSVKELAKKEGENDKF